MNLHLAGVVTTRQAAIFIHLGRCGLLGSTIPAVADALKINRSTVAEGMYSLAEMKLITATGRATGQGRANQYVVTVHGWGVLTETPDFSMFTHVQTPLETR